MQYTIHAPGPWNEAPFGAEGRDVVEAIVRAWPQIARRIMPLAPGYWLEAIRGYPKGRGWNFEVTYRLHGRLGRGLGPIRRASFHVEPISGSDRPMEVTIPIGE